MSRDRAALTRTRDPRRSGPICDVGGANNRVLNVHNSLFSRSVESGTIQLFASQYKRSRLRRADEREIPRQTALAAPGRPIHYSGALVMKQPPLVSQNGVLPVSLFRTEGYLILNR
jgi:hypothetical protein